MGSQYNSFITFNVAGLKFTTSKDTILKEPASRIALIVRGVLPVVKDDSGAIFLDRDAKYFQLVLNYLRDGWCQLPKTVEERRELLQEIRYYQLAGMEAWMRSQDVLGEAALRPQSPDPYSPNTGMLTSSPGAYQQTPSTCSAPGCSSGNFGAAEPVANSSPGGYQIRSSFLTGANQDLLTAGAFSGIRLSSMSPSAHKTVSFASPEPAAVSNSALLYSPSLPRPSSASPYVYGGSAASSSSGPVDVAAGYAAGFAAGQQQSLGLAAAAVRRSLSPGLAELLGNGLSCGGDISGQSAAGAVPHSCSKHLPVPITSDGFKWTNRYLSNNTQMQEVVSTLLELAHVAPHPSLHAGKTTISFNTECDHDRISGIVGMSSLDSNRFKYQVIRVKSSMGWSFEFSLRPSSDLALYEKFNIAEYLQDNWFVLTACLKDMYGIALEEDSNAKPKCIACRRNNITITLQKHY